MTETQEFLAALREWRDGGKGTGAQDFATLVTMLIYYLGSRAIGSGSTEDTLLQELERRVLELQKRERMSEDFLITSLTHAVRELLQHNLEWHGNAIVLNEGAVEQGVGPAVDVLKRLREPGYAFAAKLELHSWDRIVLDRLGPAQRLQWDSERLDNIAQRSRQTWEGLSEEVRLQLEDVPLGALARAVPQMSDLAKLTAEQAKEIRDRWEQEKEDK